MTVTNLKGSADRQTSAWAFAILAKACAKASPRLLYQPIESMAENKDRLFACWQAICPAGTDRTHFESEGDAFAGLE
jgi:hypothetical protein